MSSQLPIRSTRRSLTMHDAGCVTAFALLVLGIGSILFEVDRVVAQSGSQRREIVQAGAAKLQVTIKGNGDPIVFIPSRGRGVDDFDDVSTRLVEAGYQAILPGPRGIGASTGPLDGITYHDFASDVAAVIESVAHGRPPSSVTPSVLASPAP